MGGEGLVNMRDWYDTQSVLFVVVGVTAHILKKKKARSRIYRININSNKADIDM